jgi:hypothetical protein
VIILRLALAALLALAPSVALAGDPLAFITLTAPPGANDNRVASTAFVQNAVGGGSLALASGRIFIGSAGGLAAQQTMSGDCTISIAGAIVCTQTNGVAFGTAAAHPSTDFQTADPQLSSLIRQNSQSANYTTVLTDGGKHLLHPSVDTTARTFTIDSNANVAYPIGTAITFINQNGAGVITIAITSDTMRLAGPGTTGSRTLAANGTATALKITATEWIISGTGLT